MKFFGHPIFLVGAYSIATVSFGIASVLMFMGASSPELTAKVGSIVTGLLLAFAAISSAVGVYVMLLLVALGGGWREVFYDLRKSSRVEGQQR